MQHKLLGPIVISLEHTKLTNIEATILAGSNYIGGVILFSRNFHNYQQLIDLINSIKEINPNLIIMIDHEGGKVWRLHSPEFFKPEPMQQLGLLYQTMPEKAMQLAYEYGKRVASELKNCGIDLNLAPVIDLDYGISAVIGDRAFHADPAIVTLLAYHWIQGTNSAGMPAIGKHFPGHGAVAADPHLITAIDPRTKEQISAKDLIPFSNLIIGNPQLKIPADNLSGIMPSHIIYPNIDPTTPVSLSETWLKNILRNELNFNGVIISDCLSMEAAQLFKADQANTAQLQKITGSSCSAEQLHNLMLTQQALRAGCDLVIFNKLHNQELISLLKNIAIIDPTPIAEKIARSQRIYKLLDHVHASASNIL